MLIIPIVELGNQGHDMVREVPTLSKDSRRLAPNTGLLNPALPPGGAVRTHHCPMKKGLGVRDSQAPGHAPLKRGMRVSPFSSTTPCVD